MRFEEITFMETKQYDAIVIGAGQSGVPLSSAMARSGWKTALVEKEHLGGTCINEGCTPTKTMVASARVAYLARRAWDYGVKTGPVEVDLACVRQRKRDMVQNMAAGIERRLDSAGVEIFRGEGGFSTPSAPGMHTVIVREGNRVSHVISAPKVFIDTGAHPSKPDITGLEKGIPVLNSTTIMDLDTLPEHLLVLGGGYVSLEFSQMFRRFGSRVTIIQRGSHLLTREDPDVADAMVEILRQDGVDILLDAQVVSAETGENKGICLTIRTQQEERKVYGSHLLSALGRTPNSANLNLSAVGLSTDKKGFIPVNERLETSVPGIYALGDVKGGPAFTHISYDDYRIICANLLQTENGKPASTTTTNRMVPYVVFTDPQLARVGLSESEARAQGKNIQVAKIPMNYVARALEVDESRGFMKAVIDPETSQILGAVVLGIEGGEIMAMVQLAMQGNLPYQVLRDGIFAHPTLSEALNTLFSFVE
jgi:pyruvate/2-oxoglutarate dehydrogenase complex dihydrolipoamide dehydrogenase (E3) component